MIRITGILAVLSLVLVGVARGDTRDLEFFQALRDQGLGDIAVGQLEQYEADAQIPADVAPVFDLELARSLMSEADSTPNVNRAAQNLVRARERLEKFLKEHSDHVDAATAYQSIGQISLSRGEKMRVAAEAQKDPARQAAELTAARAELEQARPAFQKAVDLFGERFNQLRREQASARNEPRARRGAARPRSKEQSALELAAEDWFEARLMAASVDYVLGMTYRDPADPARIEALKRASKGFDDIFQARRLVVQGGEVIFGGVRAHFWQGKALEALGDLRTALDVYQEVLQAGPEATTRGAEETLDFFGEVQRVELQTLIALKKEDEAFEEASVWLEQWDGSRRRPIYQAIALDFVRMLQERTDSLDPKASEKLVARTLSILNDMAKVPGPYQTEAIRLRRDLSAKMGRSLDINTFADAVAMAEAAYQSGDWKEAITSYDKALELSKDVLPVDRVDKARYQRAYAILMSGDAAAALDAAEALAKEAPDRATAPSSAVLAINAALNLAATSPDKDAARKRLFAIADYVKTTWPKRAEAAEAALALGRLQLVEGDYAGAVSTFESLDSSSERYPQALFLAAQTRWRVLQQERRTNAVASDAIPARRDEILKTLQSSIAKHEQALSPAAPPPQSLDDARLLLAEVLQDAGKIDEAIALYQPLVQAVMAQTGPLTASSRNIATGAAAAYLNKGDVSQAKSIADFLAQKGDDVLAVNTVLVNLAATLRDQAKKAAAAGGSGNAGDEQAILAFVEPLTGRQQLSLRDRVVLGDIAAELGRSDLARSQYEKALAQAESDPETTGKTKAALTRVRAQLVGLLRREKKFDQALTEVDKLLTETPKALEPNMERARILQAQADETPSRRPEAVAAWGRLRNAMEKMPKKPPEYYEAVYSLAECLAAQAETSTDAAAAAESRKQAQALLKRALALAPELSGPAMVEQYKALLARIPQ